MIELQAVVDIELEILEVGSGPIPEPGQTLHVYYIGRFADGTAFDTYYTRDNPFVYTHGIGQVIVGWELAFAQLSEGSRAIITIPPELAYGHEGTGEIIPPDTTLVFEVELLQVVR